jgi:hypothetical protein
MDEFDGQIILSAMDVFFNELSVRPASSVAEARQWIETLAGLGKLLRQVVDPLTDNQFAIRVSHEFNTLPLFGSEPLIVFLQQQFGFSDPIYGFLLGVLDAPYISEKEADHADYEYTAITVGDQNRGLTGLAAAYLKNALAISFASHPDWATCQIAGQLNRLDNNAQETMASVSIDHASRQQHIVDCHLPRLAALFDRANHRPAFDALLQRQTLMPLVLAPLCGLMVGDDWDSFYHNLSRLEPGERVVTIETVANRIAQIHGWEPATGNLKTRNANRLVYRIPGSNLLVSVDTQHGEFEVHTNQSGNNHLGALSFDRRHFKPAISTRRLAI